MAPEYAMHGQLSVKADVYSFGVLLLELMAGRKNTDNNLSGWVRYSDTVLNIFQAMLFSSSINSLGKYEFRTFTTDLF